MAKPLSSRKYRLASKSIVAAYQLRLDAAGDSTELSIPVPNGISVDFRKLIGSPQPRFAGATKTPGENQ